MGLDGLRNELSKPQHICGCEPPAVRAASHVLNMDGGPGALRPSSVAGLWPPHYTHVTHSTLNPTGSNGGLQKGQGVKERMENY